MLQVKTIYHTEKHGFGYLWLSKIPTHPPKPTKAEPFPAILCTYAFPAHPWVWAF